VTTVEEHRSIWADLVTVPFTQGFVDVGGVRTRYVQAGPVDKPAVVMIHGTMGHWETFCSNIPEFSKTKNCIAYDMLGSGFSAKPDLPYEIPTYAKHLGGLMDVLGVESASLIGVSLGAWVAVRFAHDYPDRTENLVLMSTTGLYSDPATMQNIKASRSRVVDDPSWENCTAIIRNLVLDEKNCIPDMVRVRQLSYMEPGVKESADRILQLQDPTVRARNNLTEGEWRSIKTRTLLVAAPSSDDIYLDTTRKVIKILPNAELAEIDDVGHWPHFEQPDEFNRVALAFLAEGERAGR